MRSDGLLKNIRLNPRHRKKVLIFFERKKIKCRFYKSEGLTSNQLLTNIGSISDIVGAYWQIINTILYAVPLNRYGFIKTSL